MKNQFLRFIPYSFACSLLLSTTVMAMDKDDEDLNNLPRSLQGPSIKPIAESLQSVGRITLEELIAANPMTLQIQELSSYIQILEGDEPEQTDVETITNTLNSSANASERIRTQIVNSQFEYFQSLAANGHHSELSGHQISNRTVLHESGYRWNPSGMAKEGHNDVYQGVIAQKKYADETAMDLDLAKSIYLKFPQLLAFAIDKIGGNFDADDNDNDDENGGVAPVPSVGLGVWINRNWNYLDLDQEGLLLKKFLEMYIDTYDSYHTFILKHLPGRAFLNAIKQ